MRSIVWAAASCAVLGCKRYCTRISLTNKQIGAIVNFVGYYVIGIPFGLYTAFSLGWQLYGLWSGLTIALIIVSIVEIAVIVRIDWQKQTKEAADRLALEAEHTQSLLDQAEESVSLL